MTCDRCCREIKAGDRYYIEDIDLYHVSWNGKDADRIEGEDVEQRTRDLCEACRVGLYGPKEKLANDPAEPELIPAAAEEPVIAELPMTENITVGEMPLVGEDVETGEAVELDGKIYAECQPEPTLETREVAERIVAMGKQKKRLTDAQKEQIVRMMQDGTTMEKAAKTVGRSPQTVCNVWRKYNTSQEAQNGR